MIEELNAELRRQFFKIYYMKKMCNALISLITYHLSQFNKISARLNLICSYFSDVKETSGIVRHFTPQKENRRSSEGPLRSEKKH